MGWSFMCIKLTSGIHQYVWTANKNKFISKTISQLILTFLKINFFLDKKNPISMKKCFEEKKKNSMVKKM